MPDAVCARHVAAVCWGWWAAVHWLSITLRAVSTDAKNTLPLPLPASIAVQYSTAGRHCWAHWQCYTTSVSCDTFIHAVSCCMQCAVTVSCMSNVTVHETNTQHWGAINQCCCPRWKFLSLSLKSLTTTLLSTFISHYWLSMSPAAVACCPSFTDYDKPAVHLYSACCVVGPKAYDTSESFLRKWRSFVGAAVLWMYTVSQKKNKQNCFCYNYVKLPPNLTIFDTKMANSL